jgi:uncharacterized protein (TIGR02145 family)
MQPPGPPRRCDSNQELSSKPGAIHTGTQFLVLSSVTNAAEIFYTTNGDVPTSASTKYTAPIKLMASQTIKAIAMKTGMATSAVDSASYTIKPGATSTGSLILGNQTYRTVKIDEQNWMAENLNFRGSGADTVGVCYRDSVGYCAKNGRLYTWAEVMNLPDSCSVVSCASQIKPKHQGICPTGWHVPTKAEWTSLTDFTGSEGISSLPLRTDTGWKDMRDGTDIYGFSVLPAGARYPTGEYECNGNYAFFWSATEQSPKEAWRRYFSYGYEYGCSYFFEKTYGRSLRCVED